MTPSEINAQLSALAAAGAEVAVFRGVLPLLTGRLELADPAEAGGWRVTEVQRVAERLCITRIVGFRAEHIQSITRPDGLTARVWLEGGRKQ